MTRSTLSSAVVAGVMAALVSIGGPGIAVAISDPGSHSSQSRDRDGRGSQRDGSQRNDSGDRRGDDHQRGGGDGRGDGRTGGPGGPGDFNTGRDLQSPDRRTSASRNPNSSGSGAKPSNSRSTSTGASSARSAATSEQARGQTDEQVIPDVEQQEPVLLVPEPPAVEAGGGGGGGGGVGAAVTSSAPPRVVFGNGRTPGPPAERSDAPPIITPIVVPSADVPAPAAVIPAPPAPSPHGAPTLAQRTMAPLLTPTAPAASVSSLWGLAGLVLAPLAGVLLGYRQARANKAAAELKSTLSR